jgi:hypothetical protein
MKRKYTFGSMASSFTGTTDCPRSERVVVKKISCKVKKKLLYLLTDIVKEKRISVLLQFVCGGVEDVCLSVKSSNAAFCGVVWKSKT